MEGIFINVLDLKKYTFIPAAGGDILKEEIKYHIHELIPEHVPLSKEEEEELLKKLNTTKQNLPKIKKNDMGLKIMMRKHGFKVKKGMIIKITRMDFTGQKYDYYRVVE